MSWLKGLWKKKDAPMVKGKNLSVTDKPKVKNYEADVMIYFDEEPVKRMKFSVFGISRNAALAKLNKGLSIRTEKIHQCKQ